MKCEKCSKQIDLTENHIRFNLTKRYCSDKCQRKGFVKKVSAEKQAINELVKRLKLEMEFELEKESALKELNRGYKGFLEE